MRKRSLALVLVLATVLSQLMGDTLSVTATELPTETEFQQEAEPDTEIVSTEITEQLTEESEIAETSEITESESAEPPEQPTEASESTETGEMSENESAEPPEQPTEESEPTDTETTEVPGNDTEVVEETEAAADETENEESELPEVEIKSSIRTVPVENSDEWGASIYESENGLRTDGYTWLFVGERQTFHVDVQSPEGSDYTVDWEVGVKDENNDFTAITSGEGAVNYEISGDSITITGVQVQGSLQLHAIVSDVDTTNTLAEAWVDFDVREEVCEYRFPFMDDIPMLPFWDYNVDKNFCCYLENPSYPYGEEVQIRATGLVIENASDDEGEGNAISVTEWDDSNGWNFRAERFGHAVGTYTYTDVGGHAAQKTFQIWIGQDVYQLNINSDSGVDAILPGGTMDLTADLTHECYTEEEGHYPGSIEGVTYEWVLESTECTDIVTMQQDSTNTGILHVSVSAESNSGLYIRVGVRALMPGTEGQEEVAYQAFDIWVWDDYYRLAPIGLESQDLAVNETVEVTPELYHYCTGQEVQTITTGMKYRWEWDTNAIQITDSTGTVLTNENPVGVAPFTLKKLKNWNTDVTLIAELPDEGGNYNEIARRSWSFFEQNYDVWYNDLRGDGHTWLYSGESGGETLELVLNTENINGKDCQIAWEVGLCDESGNFMYYLAASDETYSINNNQTAITLHANGIRSKLEQQLGGAQEDIWFQVRTTVSANGEEVSRTDAGVRIQAEKYEYHFNFDDNLNMLPYWEENIDKNLGCYVETAEHPEGIEMETAITAVSVRNASDDMGDGDVITVVEWDNGNGWNLRAERFGHAVGTISYTTIAGKTAQKTFDIWVGSDVYNLNIFSNTGVDTVLPGEGIDLTADFLRQCYTEENGHYQGSTDGVTYEWLLEDSNCADIATIEQDAENPAVLHISVNANNSEGWNIPVAVRAYMPGDGGREEVAYQNFNICVCNNYYRLTPIELEKQDLAVNGTVQVTPELYLHCIGQEPQKITDGVQYRWEWDTNAIEITDSTDTVLSSENPVGTAPFTLKKLENWNTNVNLLAELQDEGGNYSEVTRRSWDFWEQDYGVWFDDLRNDGYTWIYTNSGDGEAHELALNAQNLEGKDCEIVWEVGICDEEGNFTYTMSASNTTYSIREDWKAITLYANGIRDALQTELGNTDENICFNVRATIRVNGVEVARTDCGAEVRPERANYYYPEDASVLLTWGYGVDKMMGVYVENPEHPYGEEMQTQITSLTVANAEDDTDEGDVATLVEREDGSGWDICMNRYGHAIGTYEYQTIDGSSDTRTFHLWVGTDVYHISFETSTGHDVILPGDDIDLSAELQHYCYDEENGEYIGSTEGVTYEWILEDRNCEEIMTMETDTANPALLHIHTNRENSSDWCIPISVRASMPGENGQEEVAYRTFNIYVQDFYYYIAAESVITEPGERIELPVELRLVSLENPQGSTMQDVNFWMESYVDIVSVDERGTGIQIAEGCVLAEDDPIDVGIHIFAEMTDAEDNLIHIERDTFITVCEHQYQQTASTPSTCTKKGSKTYRCSKCGKEKTEILPVLAHTYKETLTKAQIGKDGSIIKACSRCGLKASVTTIYAINSVKLSQESYTYNGKECKPTVTVKDRKGNTIAASNYTVAYANGCKYPGTYHVTVTFKGNYEGTKILTYKVALTGTSVSKLTAEKAGFKLTWKAGATGVGYEIQYATSSKFTGAKTKTISSATTTSQSITGLKATKKYYVRIRTYVSNGKTKSYSGWSDVKTVITKDKKGKLSPVTTIKLSKTEYTYNGKVQKPTVTIKDKAGNALEEGTDYTVSYSSGCKNPGGYTVTVTFKNNYSSTKKKTLSYTIVPKSVAISKITAKSKGLTVTWGKGTEITGYEIQYSTSSKFKGSTTKTVTVSSSKTTSKAISKLSAKKKYYVRVRTYKTAKVNGKSEKIYSEWSKTKNVTTK